MREIVLIIATLSGVFSTNPGEQGSLCISRSFKNPTHCKKCVFSFILNGQCFLPKKIIKNCLSYNKDSTCQSCKFGYVLKEDQTKCYSCLKTDCAYCLMNPGEAIKFIP